MDPYRVLSVIVALCLWLVGPLQADVFVLSSGGTIEGELLNPDQNPRTTYEVATSGGGRMVLSKAQVIEIRAESEEERRYKQILPRMPKTAEGNWLMAEWCRKVGLLDHRERHLEQVLVYDPDHAQARAGLGFNKLEGKWIRTDEWMVERGFLKHRGSWRLKQEIELEERKRKTDLAIAEWNQKLKMWRSWLIGRTERKATEARENMRELRDPLAATGLGLLLENPRELTNLKLMYIEKLGQLDCPAATNALLKRAMDDKSAQVREACWDELARDASPSVVASLTKELEGKENHRVNRAAVGLARMKDPSAIPALIDAVVTKHKKTVNVGGGGPGRIGAAFRPGGGVGGPGGLNVGGGGPKVYEFEYQNREVLDALVSLSEGANFQFSKEKWRNWYARLNTPPNINLRRSE
jgi:hypothetical protein